MIKCSNFASQQRNNITIYERRICTWIVSSVYRIYKRDNLCKLRLNFGGKGKQRRPVVESKLHTLLKLVHVYGYRNVKWERRTRVAEEQKREEVWIWMVCCLGGRKFGWDAKGWNHRRETTRDCVCARHAHYQKSRSTLMHRMLWRFGKRQTKNPTSQFLRPSDWRSVVIKENDR